MRPASAARRPAPRRDSRAPAHLPLTAPDRTAEGSAPKALWRRAEEIRALCGLPALPGEAGTAGTQPASLAALVELLLRDLEGNFRRELATRVQLEGLVELVSLVARDAEPHRPYHTLVAYLARALDLPQLWLGVLQGHPPAFSLYRAFPSWEGVPPVEHAPIDALDPAWLRWVAIGEGEPEIAADPFGLRRGGPWTVLAIHGEIAPDRLGGQTPSCPGALRGEAACSVTGAPLTEMAGGHRACGRCEFQHVIGLMGVEGETDAERRSALEAITPSLGALLANLSLNEALDFEARFREDVIEHLPLGVVAVDRSGRILTWNRYAEEIMGTSRDPEKRATVKVLIGAEAWRAALDECLIGGEAPAPFECPVKRPDGSAIPVEVNMAALRDAQGGIRGAIVTLADVSSLRTMEDRIRQLDRLAALGRFASSMAHEIRNPLTGIATGVQYLSRGFPEGDERQEDVRFILREVTRLNGIVQDLLSATRPRSLTLGPVSIADTAQRAVQSLGTAIGMGGVQIRLENADHWPKALADTDQLLQVFLNLFQNAVSAMPEGGIVTVRVHAVGPPHAPRVAIEISDTGRGIAPEHLPRLFEPFFTTRPKGTGLGLFVAHGIVQRHGGSIEVASEVDKGTRIKITLPGAAA